MKGINLLPKDLRPKKGGLLPGGLMKLLVGSPINGAAALALLWGVGLLFWGEGEIGRYQSEIQQLQKDIQEMKGLSTQGKSQLQEIAIERSKLLTEQEKLEVLRQVMDRARQPGLTLSATLMKLVTLLPERMWITKLQFDGQILKIVGIAQDTPSIVHWIAVLDESGRFRETTFAYSQRLEERTEMPYTFEISTVPVAQGAHRP